MTIDEHRQELLFGRLLNQELVKLDHESLNYTTLWACDHQNVACLNHDSKLAMKVFHSMCEEYDRPFVIDVGAHIGTFSLEGALRDNVQGLSFEPYAKTFNILKRNIELNSLSDRVTLFNKALTNCSGKLTLNIPSNNINSHLACIGYPNYRQYFEQVVEAVTLDEIMLQADIYSVDIMRIDTEGSELHVLLGATETINKYRPDLLIKYNWFKCAQSEIFGTNLLNYLAVLGYQSSWVGDEDLICRHPERNRRRTEQFAGWGMENHKIALVKQKYDEFGPWQNEMYDASNPLKVLNKWPTKYTYFEMTQLYKADWYVLPYCHDSRIVRQKINKYGHEFDNSTQNVGSINDIPLDDYDIVISLDPILRPSTASKTLFAYLQNEHHDAEYIKSLKSPLHGYDLFLDHMMDAPDWVYNLPQAVAYPYTRDPIAVRKLRSRNQDNSVWIDNRFVMMLSHGNEACHNAVNEKVLHNLERETGIKFRFMQASFDNIQQMQTPYSFLQELSQSKYYLNLIACGAGQGLCDAASLGLICFGTPKLKYHQAICHPNCLCYDFIDFKRKFRQVANSSDLQHEIMAWQDLMLADRMVRQPLHMLDAALDLKRSKLINRSKTRSRGSCVITQLELNKDLSPVVNINKEKLKLLAKDFDSKNDYDAVIDCCNQALFFDDNDVEIYFILACAYYADGDHIKALEFLDKLKKLNDQYKPADRLLALIGSNSINAYIKYIQNFNSSVSKLRKYIDAATITQIDDFDLANNEIYDEIINDLASSLKKKEKYEISRLIIYHLGKQLKTVVSAELAGCNTTATVLNV